MTRLSLTEKRKLAREIPAHQIQLIRKRCLGHGSMKGSGIGSLFKTALSVLGPIASVIGAPILKELVVPVAKKIKKTVGLGSKPAGRGLRLAGRSGRGSSVAGGGLKLAGKPRR